MHQGAAQQQQPEEEQRPAHPARSSVPCSALGSLGQRCWPCAQSCTEQISRTQDAQKAQSPASGPKRTRSSVGRPLTLIIFAISDLRYDRHREKKHSGEMFSHKKGEGISPGLTELWEALLTTPTWVFRLIKGKNEMLFQIWGEASWNLSTHRGGQAEPLGFAAAVLQPTLPSVPSAAHL